MKKLLSILSLLFLSLSTFGQTVSTVETGNEWQRVAQKGGFLFKKYIGLPRLDTSKWGSSYIFSDLFISLKDSSLMWHNPLTERDEPVIVVSDSGTFFITPNGLKNAIGETYVSSTWDNSTRELTFTREDGTTVTHVISGGGGGTIQTLSIAGQELSISEGNTVTLPQLDTTNIYLELGELWDAINTYSPDSSMWATKYRLDTSVAALVRLSDSGMVYVTPSALAGTLIPYKQAFSDVAFDNVTRALTLTRISGGEEVVTIPAGGGGGGATDLSIGTRTASTLDINSSTGGGATVPGATISLAGLMSATDKEKLNGIQDGANLYVHPNSGITPGTYTKATYNLQGHATAAGTLVEGDIPPVGLTKVVGLVDSLSSLRGATNAAYNSAAFDNATRTLTLYRLGGGNTPVNIPGGGLNDVTVGGLSPLFSTSKTGPSDAPIFNFSQLSQAAGNLFAAPESSTGAPVFRRLAASDIDANLITLEKLQNIQSGGFLGNKSPFTGQVGILSFNPVDFTINQASGQVSLVGGGGGGTVSSVGLSATGPLSVTGSPVTSSGTMSLNWTGSGSMLVAGNGSLVAYPSYSGSSSIVLSGSAFQRAALTGDVTAPQNDNVLTIAPKAVTFAKMQDVTGPALIGRGASGSGPLGAVSIGSGLSLSTGNVLSATGGGGTVTSVGLTGAGVLNVTGGPITSSGNMVLNWTGNITDMVLANGSTAPVPAVPTASTSIISNAGSFQRAALIGDVTAAQNVNATIIAQKAVTFPKMQDVTGPVLIGRGATGAGPMGEITVGTGLGLSPSGVLSATGGSGTVTSVNVTGSGVLGVTGGPITGSGTMSINWIGNNGQIVLGDGSLQDVQFEESFYNLNYISKIGKAGLDVGDNVGGGGGLATSSRFYAGSIAARDHTILIQNSGMIMLPDPANYQRRILNIRLAKEITVTLSSSKIYDFDEEFTELPLLTDKSLRACTLQSTYDPVAAAWKWYVVSISR